MQKNTKMKDSEDGLLISALVKLSNYLFPYFFSSSPFEVTTMWLEHFKNWIWCYDQ